MTLREIQIQATKKERARLRSAGLCHHRWLDDELGAYVWCERPLTTADRLDNADGYCAKCAGILSDNGEW